MAEKVKMPKFGETMTEGTISTWLKEEGDMVESGKPLFEVETDKANLEVGAPADGVLVKIFVIEGESASIGDVVAIISEKGTEIEQISKEDNTKKIEEQSVSKENSFEKINQEVKKTRKIESKKIKASPAAKRLARENGVELSQIKEEKNGEPVIAVDVTDFINSRAKATTVARNMAENLDIDLNEVKGTGVNGLITQKDIESLEKNKEETILSTGNEISLSGIRKTVAQRMSLSYKEAPQVTLTTKVNMNGVISLRKKLLKISDEKISFNDILTLSAAKALKKHPDVNVHVNDESIFKKDEINIGMAVAIDQGLVVPVIRNVDKLGLDDIAEKRKKLVEKARGGNLSAEDMQDGTFTISNLGNFGIEIFTPIINPPEAAILGVGEIKKEPVVINDKVVVQPMMWLSLTFDHRAFDGAPAAKFLKYINKLLGAPENLLL